MATYRNSTVHFGRRRKSRTGLKIFLGIVIAIVIILGIIFALNYKTIMLSTGNGSANINSLESIKKSLSDSKLFNGVNNSVDSAGNSVTTCTSKDGAVSYTITQQKNGKETVNADIDLKKLKSEGINKSEIKSGNVSAINKAKSIADQYVTPIVGSDQASGMELYLAKEIMNQGAANPDNINVNHKFGDVTVQVTGNLSADSANVKLSK